MAIFFRVFIGIILMALSLCFSPRRRSKKAKDILPLTQIPKLSNEIKEIVVDEASSNNFVSHEGVIFALNEKFSDKDSEKSSVGLRNGDHCSQSGSFTKVDARPSVASPSPLSGLPEFSHLGWGHWFTLRDLEVATDWFSKDNIIGEGGYGVVYRGYLINGIPVAVKKLLNNL